MFTTDALRARERCEVESDACGETAHDSDYDKLHAVVAGLRTQQSRRSAIRSIDHQYTSSTQGPTGLLSASLLQQSWKQR